MDKELKQKWIDALRSGKYEQGTGSLEDNGKYCCLGVLAVVGELAERRAHSPSGRTHFYWGDGVFTSSTFPDSACLKVGLWNGVYGMLMHMNDSDKKSFAEIADWIEENI